MVGDLFPEIDDSVAAGLMKQKAKSNTQVRFFTGCGGPELALTEHLLHLQIPGRACYGFEVIDEQGQVDMFALA